MKRFLLALSVFFITQGHCQQFKKLLNCINSNGTYPAGNLITDSTWLYGTARGGGMYDKGVVFKTKLDGSNYTILATFNDTNGSSPSCGLIKDGTWLYGSTSGGGTFGYGTLFKVKTDGSGFTVLFTFDVTYYMGGEHPAGNLFYDGVWLYGATEGGAFSDIGRIWKIKPDGTGFTPLYSFNTSGINGAGPAGSFIFDNTFFYGMTLGGGAKDSGVVYKIMPDGTNFTVLYNLGGLDGGLPWGGLTYDGTWLYGVTQYGGIHNYGVIFKIKPDGTMFTKLKDFEQGNISGNIGCVGIGNLVCEGNWLYGTTFDGGLNNTGVIYKIKTDGTGYTILFNSNSTVNDGAQFNGSMLSYNNSFYGTTYYGGTSGRGILYKFSPYCLNTNVLNQQLICMGTGYSIGTHTYTAAGTYVDTLQSVYGCDSIVTTKLSLTASNNTVSICAGSNYVVGTHTYSTNGIYTDTLQSSLGCDSIVTTNLSTASLPTASISVTNPTCPEYGSSVTLSVSGKGPFTYNWYHQCCGPATTADSITTLTHLVGMITDSVLVTDSRGCSVTEHYTVTNMPIVVTLDSFSNVFCIGHCYNLTYTISGGNPPYSMYWMGPPGNVDGNHSYPAGITICQNDSNVLYDYQVVDANGCFGPTYNYQSIWVVVKDCSSGVEQYEVNSRITVYPNPANSVLQLTVNSNEIRNLMIYDALGNPVNIAPQVLNNETIMLNISTLSNGVYFLRWGTNSQKFVVQH